MVRFQSWSQFDLNTQSRYRRLMYPVNLHVKSFSLISSSKGRSFRMCGHGPIKIVPIILQFWKFLKVDENLILWLKM